MSTVRVLIEAEKCTACQLCVVACKDEHVGNARLPWTKPQPETGHFWMEVRQKEHGVIPRVRMSHLPVMCQHCTNAACMKVCPEDAIKRRPDGLVWIDQDACTNCGLCQAACPYDVIFMNAEAGVAQKCTGCAHRIDAGEQPRCAEACPHDVISFATGAAEGEVFHPEFLAEPLVRWTGLPRPFIAGSVLDAAADEVIVDATVTATDLFDDRVHRVATDAFGEFRVLGLEPGRRYRVEIAAAGYRNWVAIVATDGDRDLGDIALARP